MAKKLNTEDNKNEIKELIWEMICSASDQNINPFITKEYGQLVELGLMFASYKQDHERMARMTNEERIMFTLFIYHSLP